MKQIMNPINKIARGAADKTMLINEWLLFLLLVSNVLFMVGLL